MKVFVLLVVVVWSIHSLACPIKSGLFSAGSRPLPRSRNVGQDAPRRRCRPRPSRTRAARSIPPYRIECMQRVQHQSFHQLGDWNPETDTVPWFLKPLINTGKVKPPKTKRNQHRSHNIIQRREDVFRQLYRLLYSKLVEWKDLRQTKPWPTILRSCMILCYKQNYLGIAVYNKLISIERI